MMRRDLLLSNDFRCFATVSSTDSFPSSASIMMAVATTGLVFEAMRKSVSFAIGARDGSAGSRRPRGASPLRSGRHRARRPGCGPLDGSLVKIDRFAEQRRALAAGGADWAEMWAEKATRRAARTRRS